MTDAEKLDRILELVEHADEIIGKIAAQVEPTIKKLENHPMLKMLIGK